MIKMDKILSIVVPTYNMENFLRRCLDSFCVEEILDVLEILVVNDGSTDSSLNIANEYARKYSKTFRVIDKTNGNYGSCVNKGLSICSGKYFRIVDADDWVDRDALQSFLSYLSLLDDDLVVTGYTLAYQDGRKPINVISKNIKFEYAYSLNNMPFDSSFKSSLVMHSMTFKTEILRKANLFMQEGISYTDTEYCFYPLESVETMRFLPIFLYQYYIGREGQTVSSASRLKSLNSMFLISERMLRHRNKQNENAIPFVIQLQNIFFDNILRILYDTILYNKVEKLNISRLRVIDSEFEKSLPDLYFHYNHITDCKFHYIRAWRLYHVKPSSFLFRKYKQWYVNIKKIVHL